MSLWPVFDLSLKWKDSNDFVQTKTLSINRLEIVAPPCPADSSSLVTYTSFTQNQSPAEYTFTVPEWISGITVTGTMVVKADGTTWTEAQRLTNSGA